MIYNALVIDDEIETKNKFDKYKISLKRKYDIDVNFTIVNNIAGYTFSEKYDIVLVDYQLNGAFKSLIYGTDFIKMFREKNKICKIIFFSAAFVLGSKLDFKFDSIASLINDYSIDKIVPKEERELILKAIKECCDEINLVSLSLSRMVSEYKDADIDIWYESNCGEKIKAEKLLSELILETPLAKEFKSDLYKTLLNFTLKNNL